MPITLILPFDQGQSIGGAEGYCFRLAVKWVALIAAGGGAANATNSCRPYFTRTGQTKNRTARNWEKTKAKQEEYKAASQDLEENETLANVECRFAKIWINKTLARSPQAALVEVKLKDFDDIDADDPLEAWALKMEGKQWRGLIISSAGGHTIAIYKAANGFLGFCPNYGMCEIANLDLHGAVEALIERSDQYLGEKVSDRDPRQKFSPSFVNIVI